MEGSSIAQLDGALRESDRIAEDEKLHPELRHARLRHDFLRREFRRWAALVTLLIVGLVISGLMYAGVWRLPFPAATYAWFEALYGMLLLIACFSAYVTWSRYRLYRIALRHNPD